MGAARHDEHLASFRDARRGGKNAILLAHKLYLAAYKILKDGEVFKKEMIGLEAGRGHAGHLTGENSSATD